MSEEEKERISNFLKKEIDEKKLESLNDFIKETFKEKYLNSNRSGVVIFRPIHSLTAYDVKRGILEKRKDLFPEEEYNSLLNYILREEANNRLIRGEITPKEYGEMMQGSTLNLKKQTR